MREDGNGRLERVIEGDLKGRIAVVIGAADDMADAHVEIIDADREMEER